MAIYSGFTHWKWWFSIVMLVYQRVTNSLLRFWSSKTALMFHLCDAFVFKRLTYAHWKDSCEGIRSASEGSLHPVHLETAVSMGYGRPCRVKHPFAENCECYVSAQMWVCLKMRYTQSKKNRENSHMYVICVNHKCLLICSNFDQVYRRMNMKCPEMRSHQLHFGP